MLKCLIRLSFAGGLRRRQVLDPRLKPRQHIAICTTRNPPSQLASGGAFFPSLVPASTLLSSDVFSQHESTQRWRTGGEQERSNLLAKYLQRRYLLYFSGITAPLMYGTDWLGNGVKSCLHVLNVGISFFCFNRRTVSFGVSFIA